MRTIARNLSILVTICCLLIACTANVVSPTPNIIIVTPSIKPETITLSAGDTLVVQIPTIPQPGFEWQLQNLDPKILQQVGDTVYETGTDPNSAGGITRLTFSAIGSGNTAVKLIYENPTSGLSADSYSVNVVVK